MKRRILAIFTALALALAPGALASQALGWELTQTDTQLGPGVSMTQRKLWGDSKQDYRSEWYVTYTPGQGSSPAVCYGATVPSTASVTAMAKTLESTGRRVLAGTNGDYFVMASGVPLGVVVTDGVLRSSASYQYAVGFTADGSAFVGKPELSIFADLHGMHLAVQGGYNKGREATVGYHLYNGDFGTSTRAKGEGIDVVLRPVTVPGDYVAPAKPAPFLDPEPPKPETEGEEPETPEGETAQPSQWDLWSWAKAQWEQEMAQWEWDLAWSVSGFESLPASLSIGGEITCVVESVSEHSGAVNIPEGRFVLSMDKRSDEFLRNQLTSLAVGEQVKLSVTAPDSRWLSAKSAMGAYAWIVQNGVVPDGLDSTAAPRTALGIKPNGQVILYTIDGRRPGHSVGAGVNQVAKRLVELGCDQAVLFDGGGSTTFGATGALDSAFSLQNRPSEGSQRSVTNALFFVSESAPTGQLGSLYIEPHSALMLSGARLPLSCRGIDTGYYPMGEEPVSGVTYTAQGPGEIQGDAFIAGGERGVATVTARAPGGAEGTASISVVDTPDTIRLTAADGTPVTGLNLDPDQGAALNASASWYKLDLLADDGCFTWSVSPEVGTVDPWGNVTAGPRAASGSLTVSAGAKSVSIPVTVGGHIYTLEDFEGEVPALQGLVAMAAHTADQVKLGRQSMEITYLLGEPSTLTWGREVALGESVLGFWFLGDGTAPTLTFQLLLADGQVQEVEVTPELTQSWQHLMVTIPEETVAIQTLSVVPGADDAAVAGSHQGSLGRLYLDHFTTANGPLVDELAPTAKLAVENGTVRATLRDNMDKTFSKENVTLTLDGWEIDFVLEGNTLTAPIYSDAQAHRVSLTVRDASGNMARTSVELPAAGGESPFTDIDGHWAQAQIAYLYHQGVTNGRQSGDGTLVFDPQTNITRGEFAAMLARWLRADLTAYGDASLPFVDAADIPAWARAAIGYLNREGIMTGSLEADGLYANANASLTRAQAMAMLGRVQARGYAVAQELFADDADIPTWAREHVYSLVGQGVVSGYEGYVRPQDPITRCEVAKLLTTLW